MYKNADIIPHNSIGEEDIYCLKRAQSTLKPGSKGKIKFHVLGFNVILRKADEYAMQSVPTLCERKSPIIANKIQKK